MSKIIQVQPRPESRVNFMTRKPPSSASGDRPQSALKKLRQHLMPTTSTISAGNGESEDEDDDEGYVCRMSSYKMTEDEVAQLPTLQRAVWKGKKRKIMKWLGRWENARKINKLDKDGR